ncbi:MAG TPA: hypothetical protein VHP33_20885 [Polyangiaceae bacterium]|nr:hypothetical protein [Polyangiaceae bacterium]
MHDLFNPAGLRMLEDKEGAIAYGYVAPRVFYARFVGRMSAELGTSYVRQLELAVGQVPALAYFADASALREYDLIARARFASFVVNRRVKFASLVILTWPQHDGAAASSFAQTLGEPVDVFTDPLDFELALGNVAPRVGRAITDLAHVWQVHAPA